MRVIMRENEIDLKGNEGDNESERGGVEKQFK